MGTHKTTADDGRGRTERGIVLLLCLLLLTALTLLGLSASSDAVLQNQLVSNFRDTELAKQSASAALRWAERWLSELDSPPPEPCDNDCSGPFLHANGSLPIHPEHEDLSWWQTNGQEAGINAPVGGPISTLTANSDNPPHWVIELAHEDPPTADNSTHTQAWYRLLARASGEKDTTISVVESIVVRSWPPSNNANFQTADNHGSNACPESSPAARCGRVSWRQVR